jgi:hypothetical protein
MKHYLIDLEGIHSRHAIEMNDSPNNKIVQYRKKYNLDEEYKTANVIGSKVPD